MLPKSLEKMPGDEGYACSTRRGDMLRGRREEYEYHKQRADSELAQAARCDDSNATSAHLALANLHILRSELVTALGNARPNRRGGHIYHTDKES
jgi:hypothetical protein